MLKTAAIIFIGLCLVTSQALAGPSRQVGGTVTLASASGLYVRVASLATHGNLSKGNVCGSAVNTGGVTRATTAVKIGNRVFLTGGGGRSFTPMPVAAVATPAAAARPARRKSPQGLGMLLARVLGLARP
jgi:hypothetical protein